MLKKAFLAACAVFCLIVISGTAKAAESDVRGLVEKYLLTDSASGREDALSAIAHTDGATVDAVKKALKNASAFPKVKPGLYFSYANFGDIQVNFTVYVPENYDPAKSHGLVLCLHGAGGGSESFYGIFKDLADNSGFLVASPATLGGLWWQGGDTLALGLLEHMKKKFNVDTNRVFITGFSNGGHGAYFTALRFPDLFAGAVPMSGSPAGEISGSTKKFIENAFNLPFQAIHGGQDRVIPFNTSDRTIKRMQELGFDAKMKAYPTMGHTYLPKTDRPELHEWVKSKVRKPFPKKISYYFDKSKSSRCYWLEAGSFTGLAHVEAKVEGNTITLKTENIDSLDVLLNEKLVNMGEPVVVKLNGEEVFNGRVEPNIRTLLENAFARRDPNTLFTVKVTINVKTGDVSTEKPLPAEAKEVQPMASIDPGSYVPGYDVPENYGNLSRIYSLTLYRRPVDRELAEPFVRSGLKSKVPHMRVLALKCLRYLPEDEREPAVQAARADKSVRVRAFAIAMVSPKDEVSLGLLLKALEDRDFQVRIWALRNLMKAPEQFKTKAAEAAIRELNDPMWVMRVEAIRALHAFEHKAAVGRLIETAKTDPDFDVRLAAAAVAYYLDAENAKGVYEIAEKYPHPDAKRILKIEKQGGATAIRNKSAGITQMQRRAQAYHMNEQYENAVKAYKWILKNLSVMRGEQRKQAKINAHYNIACAYSLMGKRDEAINELKLAVKSGWNDTAHMEQDTDLDNIREMHEYKVIVAGLTGKPAPEKEPEKKPEPEKEPDDEWK